jgi:hypothetical protein
MARVAPTRSTFEDHNARPTTVASEDYTLAKQKLHPSSEKRSSNPHSRRLPSYCGQLY